MSATARNVVSTPSGVVVPRMLKRWLRLAAACGVLMIGAYAIWSAQGFVVSDNAVVSAYLTALRAPIDGYVADQPTLVGSEIHRSDIIATITNPLVDDQHLTDLENHADRLAIEDTAMVRQRETLVAIRRDLMQRAQEHQRAMVARLSGQAASIEMALEARQAETEQARRDYTRKAELSRSGTASLSDLDRAQYSFESLDRQVRSLGQQLTVARAELEAADHGIFTDSGGNDVAYSVQRADEVQLRIADLDRALAAARADAKEVGARLTAERRRVEQLRSASMVAPLDGMLWKLSVSNGERMGAGHNAALLVDCSAAFLVAAVPQSAAPDVVLGGQARFRLSGETIDRTGKIISIIGDASLISDRNLAAVPVDMHKPTVMVRITLPPSRNVASECLVGRTARVLLPAASGGVVAAITQAASHIF